MTPHGRRRWRAGRATGAVTREQADAWTAEQTERARTGRLLLLAVPMFAAATRP